MFYPFEIEQFMSEHEQGVACNFAESGVHPLTLGELLDLAQVDRAALDGVLLNYPEVCGDRTLRQRIAALYPGAEADQVLVTVGASEANQLVATTLLAPGDQMVTLRPNYQQLMGNAQNLGIRVETVALVEEEGWALDLDELERRVVPATRLIALVNPHNPTGHILSPEERVAVVRAAGRVGAWIVADEVYAGTERDQGATTTSFWGGYERVIAINSMSKAYGLPGLRLGWIVAPGEQIRALWRRHEYATISASMLGMELARIALDPAVRPKLIERARQLISSGFELLARKLAERPGVFSVVPPQASAMSFVRYQLPIGSLSLAKRLLAEHDVLVVPGTCFGLEHHFRFSSALPRAILEQGLDRLNHLVGDILGTRRADHGP